MQARALFQDKIYEAWQERKVLSLMSLDVKGVYDGVNKGVLLDRLRQLQVSGNFVRWIDAFCSG